MNASRLRQCRLLAGQAWRETLHLRLVWALAGLAVGLAAGASVLVQFHFGSTEARFLRDYIETATVCGGTLLAIVLVTTLVHNGVAGRALPVLLTRGVSRTTWLVSRLPAAGAALAVLVCVGQLLLVWQLAWRGHPVPWDALVLAAWAGWLRLMLVASFALLAAAGTRSTLLAFGLSTALSAAAQLSGIIDWARGHSAGIVACGWTGLHWLVPDFARLSAMGGMAACVYASGYACLYALCAVAVFSRREL